MANVEKISVAVTAEMAASMRSVVASGEYASTSEVVRDALRDWTARRAERERAIEAIGQAWDRGVASGPAVPAEEVFANLFARLDRRDGSGDDA